MKVIDYDKLNELIEILRNSDISQFCDADTVLNLLKDLLPLTEKDIKEEKRK